MTSLDTAASFDALDPSSTSDDCVMPKLQLNVSFQLLLGTVVQFSYSNVLVMCSGIFWSFGNLRVNK